LTVNLKGRVRDRKARGTRNVVFLTVVYKPNRTSLASFIVSKTTARFYKIKSAD
jgi:hypothetical protein